MHADRTNRTALTLLGLVLLLAGAGAMALSVGLLGSARSRKPLLRNTFSQYVGAHGSWIWAAAAVLAALLALVMLRWLAALLLSTDRSGNLDVKDTSSNDRHSGEHVLGAGTITQAAVNRAVVAEIETYRGVDSVKSRTVGDSDDPQLVLTVTVDKVENLDSVRTRVESDAVAHVRNALDNPTLPVLLDFTIAKKAPARV